MYRESSVRTGFIIAVLSTGLIVSACGGGSNDTESDVNPGQPSSLVGVFQDSFVSGIAYSTETKSGVTNANGQFEFEDRESVTFSIGSLDFPAVTADIFVTPLDMSSEYSLDNNIAINVARLLQSLDVDGDATNGIEIPANASMVAAQIEFNVGSNQFEADPAVFNLIANSGSVTTDLLDSAAAIGHLSTTISGIEEDVTSIQTGVNLLADGGKKLAASELRNAFSGAYFLELAGSWDWTFQSDGTSLSASIPRGNWEGDQDWSIENNKLCRELDGATPCVTIYRKGNIYRFSMDGRDGSDNLEPWAVRRTRSL